MVSERRDAASGNAPHHKRYCQLEPGPGRLINHRGYRFPPEIISHGVWLYYRFCLSFRDVEELLAKRGILVSYETIRHIPYPLPGPCHIRPTALV